MAKEEKEEACGAVEMLCGPISRSALPAANVACMGLMTTQAAAPAIGGGPRSIAVSTRGKSITAGAITEARRRGGAISRRTAAATRTESVGETRVTAIAADATTATTATAAAEATVVTASQILGRGDTMVTATKVHLAGKVL